MTRYLTGLAIASVLLGAGCGNSQKPDMAGLRQALQRSNSSYLRYTSPTWWGHPVGTKLDAPRVDGAYALARVDVSTGPQVWRTQWALLKRVCTNCRFALDSTGWRVLATAVGQRSNLLPCLAAPRAVMLRLAGGCSRFPHGGVILGPRAERPATKSELAAITAAALRDDPRLDMIAGMGGRNDPASCITYAASISSVDPHYARVDPGLPRSQIRHPHDPCGLIVGTGSDVYVHAASGWEYAGGGNAGLSPCGWGPPGVIRSLVGACALPG